MSPRLDAFVRQLHDRACGTTADLLRRELDLSPGEEIVVWEIEPLNAKTGLGSYAVVPVTEAELWGHPPANDGDAADVPGLPRQEHEDDRRRVKEAMDDELRDVIGAASLGAFRAELAGALDWACDNYNPAKGSFLDFAHAVARVAWRRMHEMITWPALGYEKADQDRRLAAARDDRALAAYLQHVRDQVIAWMAQVRHRPRAWIADNARCQDHVCAIVLRVLELLRSRDPVDSFRPYERVGLPAFYQVRDEVLGDLRRCERVRAFEAPASAVCATILRPDQVLLEKEIRKNIGNSIDSYLRSQLSLRQQRYLDALLIEIQLDDSVWGLQERIAKRTGRGKARVSEAIARIRVLAESAEIDELIRDAATTGPPGSTG